MFWYSCKQIENSGTYIFFQTFLSLKLRSLSLSQKEFSHFKFETYHHKKIIIMYMSFIPLSLSKKKKVIYRFYTLHFVKVFIKKISKIEMVT